MPGFGEQMRQISLHFVPTAILSRQVAVIRETADHAALIINLPGQPKSIRETLEGLKDADGKQLVGRHLRRGTLLHRPDRRPVHRNRRSGLQGIPAQVGASVQQVTCMNTNRNDSSNTRNDRDRNRPESRPWPSSGCTAWAPTATISCRSCANWTSPAAGRSASSSRMRRRCR